MGKALIEHLWVPHLPPSSNAIYVNLPGKGRRKSEAAKVFQSRAMRVIQKEGRAALLRLTPDVPYELKVIVFFKKVTIKSWPAKAKSRYEKIDVSNRIKLIEDTVSKAIGLDDCHNFRIILEKQCDPENPGLYVCLSEVGEDEVGLTKEDYDSLRLRQPESDGADRPVSQERHRERAPRRSSRRPRGPLRRPSRPA